MKYRPHYLSAAGKKYAVNSEMATKRVNSKLYSLCIYSRVFRYLLGWIPQPSSEGALNKKHPTHGCLRCPSWRQTQGQRCACWSLCRTWSSQSPKGDLQWLPLIEPHSDPTVKCYFWKPCLFSEGWAKLRGDEEKLKRLMYLGKAVWRTAWKDVRGEVGFWAWGGKPQLTQKNTMTLFSHSSFMCTQRNTLTADGICLNILNTLSYPGQRVA